jgi:DNA polymerase-3 subunit epsilon
MELQLNRPIVFIDLETTGTETLTSRIVEISMLKINPDGREEIITTRINPQIPIPPEAIAIHGISDKDVANKPVFEEYALKIREFLEGCDLGGFNVKKFDLEILETEFRRAEIEFSKENRYVVDVQTIYHKLEPRDLQAAHKKYCGKEIEKHHSAEHDVRATFNILKSQLEMHNELPHGINELHDFCNERRPASWIDSKGRFVWIDNDAVMNFGPHRGKSLSYIIKNELGFLNWMMTKDFMPDAKKIVSDALNGQLPSHDI